MTKQLVITKHTCWRKGFDRGMGDVCQACEPDRFKLIKIRKEAEHA